MHIGSVPLETIVDRVALDVETTPSFPILSHPTAYRRGSLSPATSDLVDMPSWAPKRFHPSAIIARHGGVGMQASTDLLLRSILNQA